MHGQRLQIGAFWLCLKIVVPFSGCMWNILDIGVDMVVGADGQLNYIHKVFGDVVNDGRKRKRVVV